MSFDPSAKTAVLIERLSAFMEAHVYPNEARFDAEVAEGDRWKPTRIMEELKDKAKAAGLWNLFLPESELGAGLTNLEYAPLCEIMGRVWWAPEVFNCSAPDTGNMEVLARYGTEAQNAEWLAPMLDGRIRSCFAMTEPAVASSDATNIDASIQRDGDEYIINGRKWWSSGANDPRCKLFIFMGKTDKDNPNRHRQQSMIIVPRDAKGVTVLRHLPVFGYDDAPHAWRGPVRQCPGSEFAALTVASRISTASSAYRPGRRSSRSVHRQDNLANMLAGVHQLMRLARLSQREGLVDEGLDRAGGEQWPDLFFQRPNQLRFFSRGARTERRARVGQPLDQHEGQIQFLGDSPDHTNLHDTSVHRCRLVVSRDIVPSHNINDHIHASALGSALHHLDKVLFPIVDSNIGPQLQAGLPMRLRSYGRDDRGRTESFAQHRRGGANT